MVVSSSAIAEDRAMANADGSAPVSVGAKFPELTLEDQHGTKKSLVPETKTVLISSNMELSKSIHAWLKDKPATYLEDNNIQYIADITPMPGIISWLFAKPKMRKYPFTILLVDDDEFAAKFPQKEEKLAVFQLNPDRTVRNIAFVNSIEEVDQQIVSKTAPAATSATAETTSGEPVTAQ